MKLEEIWKRIEKRLECNNCPLKEKSIPLLFKPASPVKVMVVTEGPNRIEDKEFIASLGNHPTFTYLTALAGGKFIPEGQDANVYWTHLRKCFIKKKRDPLCSEDEVETALEICVKAYLFKEIEAVNPELIIAVCRAKDFFNLKGVKLQEILARETKGPITVEIDGVSRKVMIVPHPSCLNRFWTDPPPQIVEALQKVREEFSRLVSKPL